MSPNLTLPEDSEERKGIPIHAGVIRYFPAALAAIAQVSKHGNDKHNPGQPLRHSRGKSSDHADCIIRHLIDMEEGDGRDVNGYAHVVYAAWRALALCQEWLEAHDIAPLPPGARESSLVESVTLQGQTTEGPQGPRGPYVQYGKA